ncbi:MBL fold metallo-hydrolase [Aestuariispira insulae]|uniref:Glyoxylase-like metal-dependent hydrolase (Beta-lactamase superfamily II) n=1 Tax=Aestuariispira insulae TaxID=1461337 RepID=A0A3D9H3Z8_9PROT|nr:MBL fold metallo-hydrolase [Aestuariispira insulae]RED44210.1 glyoxylase-like metal-dependent hydrolase (beta-lactamase superfamily II) [Aestuariispira insulae]
MTIRIADKWFALRKVDEDITHLWEPHVAPLIQCNIWHVRGSERDMIVDTGLGIASLHDATRHLIDKPVDAVATHTHFDHVGGHHEFESRIVHAAEAPQLRQPPEATLRGDILRDWLGEDCGYDIPDDLIHSLPHDAYCPDHYCVAPAEPTRIVEEGDVIDLGNRQFEILHLPGHSPGGIGLWEAKTGILFSGDTVYDGPLLDQGEDADIDEYIRSMKRLREMPVSVVHGGHDPSFGRERLVELCDAYLRSKGA